MYLFLTWRCLWINNVEEIYSSADEHKTSTASFDSS